jgi:uracil-DNA glycosylase family 4
LASVDCCSRRKSTVSKEREAEIIWMELAISSGYGKAKAVGPPAIMSQDSSFVDPRVLMDSISDYLEQLKEEGLEGVPFEHPAAAVKPAAAIAAAPAAKTPSHHAKPPAEAGGELFSIYPGLEKTETLEALREFIGDCTRCKLAPGRTNLVFGVGDPNAELMFVGEGPGADEDERGEPFVGRAGQLLTDIIERGMRMRRQEVYICNVVKCRPPGNRNPEPDEVAACEPFLNRQIELVRPKIIVGLGTFAVQALLKVKIPISKLRGRWHEVRGIRMMPTFHPAYLLRNPADKRLVWTDIQEVMKALGKELPNRKA